LGNVDRAGASRPRSIADSECDCVGICDSDHVGDTDYERDAYRDDLADADRDLHQCDADCDRNNHSNRDRDGYCNGDRIRNSYPDANSHSYAAVRPYSHLDQPS